MSDLTPPFMSRPLTTTGSSPSSMMRLFNFSTKIASVFSDFAVGASDVEANRFPWLSGSELLALLVISTLFPFFSPLGSSPSRTNKFGASVTSWAGISMVESPNSFVLELESLGYLTWTFFNLNHIFMIQKQGVYQLDQLCPIISLALICR